MFHTLIYATLISVTKILWFHLLFHYHYTASHYSSSFCWKKMGMKIVTGPEYDTFHCLSEILSLKPIQCCWTRWIAFSGLIASLGSGMSKPVTGKENNQDRRHSIQESRPPLFFSVLCISFCHPCLTLSIWSLCLSLPQLSAFVLFYLPHLFPSLQWSHFFALWCSV